MTILVIMVGVSILIPTLLRPLFQHHSAVVVVVAIVAIVGLAISPELFQLVVDGGEKLGVSFVQLHVDYHMVEEARVSVD